MFSTVSWIWMLLRGRTRQRVWAWLQRRALVSLHTLFFSITFSELINPYVILSALFKGADYSVESTSPITLHITSVDGAHFVWVKKWIYTAFAIPHMPYLQHIWKVFRNDKSTTHIYSHSLYIGFQLSNTYNDKSTPVHNTAKSI